MDFRVAQENSTAVVVTNVEKLNATNASELKSELMKLGNNGVNNIIIDMSNTKYCDSSGLSAILVANRLCKDRNGNFVLCGLQTNVEKLIQIAQLDRVLSIAEGEAEAQALIAS